MQAASDYPFLIRQAAAPWFTEHVQDLIGRNIHNFTPNLADPGCRKHWFLRNDIDPLLTAKKLELIEAFAIGDWTADPELPDLIGYISAGGFVHAHQDPTSGQMMHVRINLLVSKPEGGGVPLLDDIPIDVDLGDAWLCFASHCRHATTPVRGTTVRSIVSYGLQVDRVAALGMFSKYLVWRMAHGDVAGLHG